MRQMRSSKPMISTKASSKGRRRKSAKPVSAEGSGTSEFLDERFFQRDFLTVAKELIGIELVWHGCSGLIVETEAYAVEGDDACHTATRPSAREFVKTQTPGTAYVYFNYGMYWLFNLLVKGGERDGVILIRALEPMQGVDVMKLRRGREKLEDLCSGPGKLTLALGITGADHCTHLVGPHRMEGVGLRRPVLDGVGGSEGQARRVYELVEDIRVGISKAVDHPWRFLVKGHPHVSVPHGKVKLPPVKAKRSRRR